METFPTLVGHEIDRKYEASLDQTYAYTRKNIPSGLPRGLIHGDLFYDNVVFAGNSFKAVIDFEESCHYYQVFDLGMGIVGLCAEDKRINLQKAWVLINGYQQIRSLEALEVSCLQLFAEYAAIATSAWRFLKYHIDSPDSERSDLHWEMVCIARDVNTIPKAEFIERVFNE